MAVLMSKFRLEIVKEKSGRYELEKNAKSPEVVVQIAKTVLKMDVQSEEIFVIYTLNIKNDITGIFEISRGSLNGSIVHPREVFKRAILQNAASIILLHNHPSGSSMPSGEDAEITKRLKECGELLGIKVVDHIIIGEDWYSFKRDNEL